MSDQSERARSKELVSRRVTKATKKTMESDVEDYIHLTQRFGYLSAEEGSKLSAMLKETAITLNGYISSIRTAEHA